MEHDEAARRAALALLAEGEITAAEAKDLAGVSRQLMRHWINTAGVDWKRIRGTRIAHAWAKAVRR